MTTSALVYDEYYFKHCCGMPYERTPQWLDFFGGIAEKIARELAPRTVLDVGCAMGFLVEQLRARGIAAFGVDVSEYALQRVHPDAQPFCWRASATEPFPQKYDLSVCIEVLEHLPPADAERAVENFSRYADDVLFLSTPSDFAEPTHFNVQLPEYWAELFARQSFFHDLDFDASFITPWAMRVRRRTDLPHRIIREYARKLWATQKENQELRGNNIAMRKRLTEREHELQIARQEHANADQGKNRAQAELAEMVNSRAWRAVKWYRRLIGKGY